MKTRYKISLVIGSFTAFFLASYPAFLICHDSGNDCTVLGELINLTRPVIHSSDIFWNDSAGISEWSGTTQGAEERLSASDYLSMNTSFIFSMIVLPCAIISVIIVWDKR